MAEAADQESTLGGRLRAVMGRLRLTSEAVGEALGVTGSTVRQWTLDYREPPLSQLKAFARFTGVSLVWLLEGEAGETRAISDAVIAFADRVAAGEDPGEVLAALTGGAVLPGLSEAAAALKRVLDAHAPALWQELSPEEKRCVLREIEALAVARRLSPPSDRPPFETAG